jgi:hypothetical protein
LARDQLQFCIPRNLINSETHRRKTYSFWIVLNAFYFWQVSRGSVCLLSTRFTTVAKDINQPAK